MAERIFIAVNRWVLVLLLAAMCCIVFANVVLRYLTNDSIVWAEEVARYLMIWMTFLSAGLALRAGMLVSVSQVHGRLPAAPRRIARLLILAVLLVFFGWMVFAGWEYLSRMGRQLTPATRIPFSYIYYAMPVGFGLLLIHTLLLARRFLAEGHFDHATEADVAAVKG
ncbi:TRAP transporter small permease [Paracoccus siganidrum]|uniref:TRAP transporter small permease protein n=1 Tax=Paracoccus siganidrum TaxID=1276757 RepID=A0A418ZS97_9RHOB|nr:TRAP transporter small permease [Paracoccus siganidrum]RJK99107.1 TRAP transporter small permease [Paracoccus siganidrum]RMC32245.1 TRAP transporter small permease [Paracoccus siganidrum]